MKLYELALYRVPNDVECLTNYDPYSLRYVQDLDDAHQIAKTLRQSDCKHPSAWATRVIITPLPRPEDHALPFCVDCGEPTADFAAHGEAWHESCYRRWTKEYNAHLEKQHSQLLAGEIFHPEPSKPAIVTP